jgi:endonuclease-3
VTTRTTTKRTTTRRRRRPADPALAWARRLERARPGLVPFTLDAVALMYGRPAWERRNDPTSELVLTILSQNSADVNAEKAFEALRAAYPRRAEPLSEHVAPDDPTREPAPEPFLPPPGWGGIGLQPGLPPDWSRVEDAPIDELIDVIRPGGLAPQKAPRIQASLRALREQRGDHSLEFLGEMSAADAEAWLTAIPGIGRKTAAVVLLFCFGLPLMPVDRHVERVAKRVGLVPPKATADQAEDVFLRLLQPDQMYEAHVNLITHGRKTCHARRPECGRCAVAPRCRYATPRAP